MALLKKQRTHHVQLSKIHIFDLMYNSHTQFKRQLVSKKPELRIPPIQRFIEKMKARASRGP